MSNLNEIYGMNRYCGPGVLSALTGLSSDICANAIAKINGKRVITAVEVPDLIRAVESLGFKVEEQQVMAQSIYGFFVGIAGRDGSYIIMIHGHVVAAEVLKGRISLIDNHTKKPINAGASARLMQRVIKAWKVTKITEEELYEIKEQERIKELRDRIRSCESMIASYKASLESYQKELEIIVIHRAERNEKRRMNNVSRNEEQ